MIVFALRHADRESDPLDKLTDAGKKRAKLLARMLGESGVSIAYCSDAARTHETLDPLVQKLAHAPNGPLTIREVKLVPGAANAHVQTIVTEVKALAPEKIAVIVSHSDTVGPIVAGLGGGNVAPIGPNEFDKLFVLIMRPGAAVQMLRLRYGDET